MLDGCHTELWSWNIERCNYGLKISTRNRRVKPGYLRGKALNDYATAKKKQETLNIESATMD